MTTETETTFAHFTVARHDGGTFSVQCGRCWAWAALPPHTVSIATATRFVAEHECRNDEENS